MDDQINIIVNRFLEDAKGGKITNQSNIDPDGVASKLALQVLAKTTS